MAAEHYVLRVRKGITNKLRIKNGNIIIEHHFNYQSGHHEICGRNSSPYDVVLRCVSGWSSRNHSCFSNENNITESETPNTIILKRKHP